MTDDLPTPPLPEATSSTRVRDAGIGERDGPALGVAVGRLGAGGRRRVAVEALAERGPLLVGHDGEVDVDAA